MDLTPWEIISRNNLLGLSLRRLRFFTDKVSVDENGCWIWTGGRHMAGYGIFCCPEVSTSPVRSHRLAYELVVGKIEEGKQLHHKCEVRECINPHHTEQLTPKEHVHKTPNSLGYKSAHVTYCPKGHPYDDKNTGYRSSGKRYCKTCSINACNERRQQIKQDLRDAGFPVDKDCCVKGHPLSGENLYVYKTKTGIGRGCKICRDEAVRTYHSKNRDKINAQKREARSKKAFYELFKNA